MRIDVNFLEKALGIKVEYFSVIDSTMNYINNLVNSKKSLPDLVIADYQTDGVGRVGRKFYSPASTGLYFTVVFPDTYFPEGDVTPRVALAVRDAIFSVFEISCSIKWVNDLYFNERKVCGILCRKLPGYISIGIGVNVEEPKYIPEELTERFGFLVDHCQSKQYTYLVKEIFSFCLLWAKREKQKVLEEYREYCNHIGREVLLYQNDKEYAGTCVDISDDFSIVVNLNGELASFSSGEMSLKI